MQTLIYKFSVIPAQILDHRHRCAKVKFIDGSEALVHAPDRLNKQLKTGVQVLVEPIDKPKVCNYKLVARKTPLGWVGANPHIVEKLILDALARGIIPEYGLVRRHPLVEGSRLDAQWVTPEGIMPLEIKSINCLYPSTRYYLFPSKTQSEDLKHRAQKKPYKKPISPRTIRQAKIIAQRGGSLLFVTSGGQHTHQLPVVLNDLDKQFIEAVSKLPKYLARLCWYQDGSVFLTYFGKL